MSSATGYGHPPRFLPITLILAGLLACTQALACDNEIYSSGSNVSEYEYSPVTGQWHLVNSWYDASYADFVPLEDDYVLPGSFGTNGEIDDSIADRRMAPGSAWLNCDEDPVELPPMTVTAPTSGPSFGWPRFRRVLTGWGGGSVVHTRVAAGVIPPSPLNTIDATCHSDVLTRFLHARQDIAHMQLAARNRAMRNRGSVQVTYSDESTERWPVLSPYSSPFIVDVPAAGSLKNCDSGIAGVQ